MFKSKMVIVCGVLTAVMALGTVAVAQQGGGAAGGGRGQRGNFAGRNRGFSLSRISVKELTGALLLTDEQVTKYTALQTKLTADSQALAPVQGAAPDPEARKKRTALNTQFENDFAALLTVPQRSKLKEIMDNGKALPNAPFAALAALRLLPKQKTDIAAIQKDQQTQIQAITVERTDPTYRTLMTDINTASQEKINKILSVDQQKIIKDAQDAAAKARGNRRNRNGAGAGAAAPAAPATGATN